MKDDADNSNLFVRSHDDSSEPVPSTSTEPDHNRLPSQKGQKKTQKKTTQPDLTRHLWKMLPALEGLKLNVTENTAVNPLGPRPAAALLLRNPMLREVTVSYDSSIQL